MDILIIIAIIVGGAILWIGGWYIRVNNTMVFLEELCDNAISQIGVYQGSKWEIIENLANMITRYSDHESNTMIKVVENRSSRGLKHPTVEGLEGLEKDIKAAVKEIQIVVEAYPELKADELYMESMGLLNSYESNLREAKLIYNDIVSRYNREIRTLPDGLFIKFIGYSTKEYIEITEAQERKTF